MIQKITKREKVYYVQSVRNKTLNSSHMYFISI